MVDETISCPLCQGRSQLTRSELMGLLADRDLRGRIEGCLAELTQSSAGSHPATGTVPQNQPRDFQRDVHSWNPQLPMWNRSPKE